MAFAPGWPRATAARFSRHAGPKGAVDSRSAADRFGDVRFPREHRLTRRAEFERVLRQRSVRIASGAFVALALANTGDGARLGMIIGKRHLPRSVDRNRVKRVIRESFRRQRVGLPHLDIVIQLAARARDVEVPRALDEIWQRLGRART